MPAHRSFLATMVLAFLTRSASEKLTFSPPRASSGSAFDEANSDVAFLNEPADALRNDEAPGSLRKDRVRKEPARSAAS